MASPDDLGGELGAGAGDVAWDGPVVAPDSDCGSVAEQEVSPKPIEATTKAATSRERRFLTSALRC
ncbi:hypothetical protein VR010_13475 [Actinomycetaceae bacterium L2_0104]